MLNTQEIVEKIKLTIAFLILIIPVGSLIALLIITGDNDKNILKVNNVEKPSFTITIKTTL